MSVVSIVRPMCATARSIDLLRGRLVVRVGRGRCRSSASTCRAAVGARPREETVLAVEAAR